MNDPINKGDKASAEVIPLRPTRPCAICKKPSVRTYYPFCSKRCADIDLNSWFSGSYVIAGTDEDSDSGDGNPPAKNS